MYPWRTSKTAGAPPSLSKNIGLFKSENVAFGGTKLPSCHLHLEVLDLSSTFQGSKTIRSEMSEGEVTWSNCKTRSTGICLLDLLASDQILGTLQRSSPEAHEITIGAVVSDMSRLQLADFHRTRGCWWGPQWVLKLCRNNGHDWTIGHDGIFMIVTCCDKLTAGTMWMPLHTRSERLRRLRGDSLNASLPWRPWLCLSIDCRTSMPALVGPAVGVNRFGQKLRCDRRPSTRQLELSAWHIVGNRISSLSH